MLTTLVIHTTYVILYIEFVTFLKVRMSSSVATREFLTHINPKEAREIYFPTLLPAMCLNRYGTTSLTITVWQAGVTSNCEVETIGHICLLMIGRCLYFNSKLL